MEIPVAAKMASTVFAIELPVPLPSRTMSATSAPAPIVISVIGIRNVRMNRAVTLEYGRWA